MTEPGRLSRTPGVLAVVCLAVALVQAAPLAPQDQRPPVFRGGATLVYVDVYPRRGDRVVEGLTRQDFQVLEDGKPQSIETFEYLHFESSPIDADRRDPTSVGDMERQAADPKNRLFVVYLDRYHTTRVASRDSRQPLIDFLNRTIGASDLFGVMTPETSVARLTFGRRTDSLTGELFQQADWGLADEMSPILPRTPIEERLIQCAERDFEDDPREASRGQAGSANGFGQGPGGGRRRNTVDQIVQLYREDVVYTSLENLVARLRGLRDERKNVLLLGQSFSTRGAAVQATLRERKTKATSPPRIGVGPGGRIGIGDRSQLGPFQEDPWCQSEFTRLSLIEFRRRFETLINEASRANVSFYPIHLGGLTVLGDGVEELRTVAGATGGRAVVNTNDFSAAFRRIADDLSGYYLLGYYSANTANDGKFRKIDVKVSQPRVDVSARRGYFAPQPDAVIAKAMADAAMRAGPAVTESVSAALGDLGRLASGQEVFTYAVARDDGTDIVAELASAEIGRGRWANGAAVALTLTDSTGNSAETAGTIAAGGRSVLLHVPFGNLRGLPLRARVHVTGDGAATDERFDVTASSGGPLLGRPVAYRGLRTLVQPVAEFRFARTERLRVEWPAVKPIDRQSARVLDRRGQPLGSPLEPIQREAAPGRRVLVIDLPLSGLADGDYLVEVTAHSGADQQTSLLAFRVVR